MHDLWFVDNSQLIMANGINGPRGAGAGDGTLCGTAGGARPRMVEQSIYHRNHLPVVRVLSVRRFIGA